MDFERREIEHGRMLGDYRVLHTVGSGGMGVVYAVWDTRLDRRVALKMIHRHLLANPDVTRRFLREARAAARVEHPNVVRVYRVESIEGEPAIEMQYIEGAPLSSLLRAVPLLPGRAADLLHQVLSALVACHAQGIIHCDLKPSNLLLDPEGTIFLTDFGISKALQVSSSNQDEPGPATGPGWGTPHYTPPEAWNGEQPTAAWDLYALGVMVYEALAGHPAFQAPSPAALMNQILNTAPEPLGAVRPDLSGEFVTLIHDLMAREAVQRPASAAFALGQLHGTPEFEASQAETQPLHLHGPIDRIDHSTQRRRRFGRWWYAMAVLLVAAATSFSIYRSWKHRGDPSVFDSGSVLSNPPGSPVTPAVAAEAPAEIVAQAKAPEPLEITGNSEGVYFTFDDGAHGRELWFAEPDGEAELVRDIVPGSGSSRPRYLFQRASDYDLIFSATTPEQGEEPWLCRKIGPHEFDVFLIKDIIPGEMGSEPRAFERLENIFFFYATTLHEGRELWITTTREQQTAMIEDLYPGPPGSATMSPNVVASFGGLYFLGLQGADYGQELFYYDHSKSRIHHIADVFDGASAMALAGNVLVLANRDKSHGVEPWIARPGAKGIEPLADIEPGPESSNPDQNTAWHGEVFFNAYTKDAGIELWKSDGTPGGTRLLADIDPGAPGSNPYAFAPGEHYLYFRATTGANGNELWRTDGTTGGTQMVVDAWPGPESGKPYNVCVRGDAVFFTAADGEHGEELWSAALSFAKEPQRIVDLWPGPIGSEPHNMSIVSEARAVFAFKSEDLGPALGVLDWHGLPMTTRVIKLPHASESDIRSGS